MLPLRCARAKSQKPTRVPSQRPTTLESHKNAGDVQSVTKFSGPEELENLGQGSKLDLDFFGRVQLRGLSLLDVRDDVREYAIGVAGGIRRHHG